MKNSSCSWHHPPKPPAAQGVLLQKIIACEHRQFAHHSAHLEVTGLPACVQPPLRLSSVQAGSGQPWWTPAGERDGCGRLAVCIRIPLCVTVCDACGRVHQGTALLDVETWLPPAFCQQQPSRQQLLILPCVSLACADSTSCDACFDALLHITLEIYLLCLEPCLLRSPAPACPDLPLYPQPCQPHSRPFGCL